MCKVAYCAFIALVELILVLNPPPAPTLSCIVNVHRGARLESWQPHVKFLPVDRGLFVDTLSEDHFVRMPLV